MNFRDQVAAFLKANEGKWIPAVEFEAVGGRQAWRTRIADCRKQLGMQIDNRQTRMTAPDGVSWTLSEYRYVAPAGQLELSL